MARKGFRLDVCAEPLPAFDRLGRSLQALAGDIELPSMIGATNAPFLVPSEIEARATVRTGFFQRAHASLGVAEHDEVFAQQSHALGQAVRAWELIRWQCRYPIFPHELPHRCSGTDAADQLVVLLGQHWSLPG